MFKRILNDSSGVALILVISLVALASMLVVQLAYSTHLQAQLSSNIEHSLQGEFLLKSAVNFARVLLKEDQSSEDSEKDLWGMFNSGAPIPTELLDLGARGVHLQLEIRPEEAKFPLRALLQAEPLGRKWRDAFVRLFRQLGFDEDKEEDQSGLFPHEVFTSEQLVAILIDYTDRDSESFDDPQFSGKGIEKNLPEGVTFPNVPLKRVGELASVPGFTPTRLRRLTPFITTFGNDRVNINFAPKTVLASLHEDLSAERADAIIAFRRDQKEPEAFTQGNLSSKLKGDEQLVSDISPMIKADSKYFQVLAKADYGASSYFMRAFLHKGAPGALPSIRSIELF
jgi:general secretion pathway protein K